MLGRSIKMIAAAVAIPLAAAAIWLGHDTALTEKARKAYYDNGFYLDQIKIPSFQDWQVIDDNRTYIGSVESGGISAPWATTFSADEKDDGSVRITVFLVEPAPLYNSLMLRWNGRRYKPDRHFGYRTLIRMRLAKTEDGMKIIASGVAPDDHDLSDKDIKAVHDFTIGKVRLE